MVINFQEGGTVTAGNASGLNDGAAAVVLMSSAKAAEKKINPLAKIIGFAQAGVDPKVMGIGPVPAVKKLVSVSETDKLYKSLLISVPSSWTK